jgi:hypothetical protein
MSDVLNILETPRIDGYWPKPRHRDFAAIGGDITVYREVLEISATEPFVTAEKLLSAEEGLRNRFRKLVLIQTPSKTNVRAMLSLLERFDWLQVDDKSRYTITLYGREVLARAANEARLFRREFAGHLHDCYIVPGWFVCRLHELNPNGQGEVILPAPPRLPGIGRRDWTDRKWPKQLDEVVVEAARHANKAIPGAFPIAVSEWLKKVVEIWDRLGSGSPPVNRYASAERNTFAVRERLFHAMREASVELLFGTINPVNGYPDFSSGAQPISYRAFSVWCPRLSEIEFIFYTDYHPRIAGRLIVPCGAFRDRSASASFEELSQIRDLSGRRLYLYQPTWRTVKSSFLRELLAVYRDESRQIGAFYVSLLVVRDEVCRRLRLSALLFDKLLESAYEDAIREMTINGKQFSISLESDIRPDQRSAIGLNQRPVYIHRIPHSLIAIGTSRAPR